LLLDANNLFRLATCISIVSLCSITQVRNLGQEG
jgi:hypothetical protein